MWKWLNEVPTEKRWVIVLGVFVGMFLGRVVCKILGL